jgi:hypothetical protein
MGSLTAHAAPEVPLSLDWPKDGPARRVRVLTLPGSTAFSVAAGLEAAALDQGPPVTEQEVVEVQHFSIDIQPQNYLVVEGWYEPEKPQRHVGAAHVTGLTLEQAFAASPELKARVTALHARLLKLRAPDYVMEPIVRPFAEFPDDQALTTMLQRLTFQHSSAYGTPGPQTNYYALSALVLAARRNPELFERRRAELEQKLAPARKLPSLAPLDWTGLDCALLRKCEKAQQAAVRRFTQVRAKPPAQPERLLAFDSQYSTPEWTMDVETLPFAIQWLSKGARAGSGDEALYAAFVRRQLFRNFGWAMLRASVQDKPQLKKAAWAQVGRTFQKDAAVGWWLAVATAEGWPQADSLTVTGEASLYINGMPPRPAPDSAPITPSLNLTLLNLSKDPRPVRVVEARLKGPGGLALPLTPSAPLPTPLPPRSGTRWSAWATAAGGAVKAGTRYTVELTLDSSGTRTTLALPFVPTMAW